MEILGSLIIAILQSILFYGKRLGISVILFMIATIGIIWYMLNKKKKIINKKAIILLIPILLLSSTYFIYGSTTFNFTNMLAIVGLILLMFRMATTEKCLTKDLLIKSILLPYNAIEEVGKAQTETNRAIKEIAKNKIPRVNIKRIISSLVITFAVVGFVIILLASADSIFASIFSGIGNAIDSINIGTIGNLILRTAICIVIYFAVLSIIIEIQKNNDLTSTEMKTLNADKFTIKMLLIVLNIVYLIFCYIQITSLFAKMNAPGTFNYAQYARSGFFQLMLVSLINFTLIFISNYKNEKRDMLVKILNMILIVFTIIIILSSIYRMHMYEAEYGFTYLRLFVYIILITELILFVPTVIYVITPKIDILKYGGIIGICIYVIINFTNLENMIITRNLKRESSNVQIDYEYISKIASSDSYYILEGLLKDENISAKNKMKIYRSLANILKKSSEIKWQEFNVSKYKIKDKKLDEIINFEELEIKSKKEEQEEEYRKNREEKRQNQINILSENEA